MQLQTGDVTFYVDNIEPEFQCRVNLIIRCCKLDINKTSVGQSNTSLGRRLQEAVVGDIAELLGRHATDSPFYKPFNRSLAFVKVSQSNRSVLVHRHSIRRVGRENM